MFRRIAAVPVAMLAGLAMAAPAVAAPTVNAPVITGEPVVGATLLATTTIATEDGTITQQWLRCSASGQAACDPIAGATSTSYVVDVADAGRRIAVRARATDATGASGPQRTLEADRARAAPADAGADSAADAGADAAADARPLS